MTSVRDRVLRAMTEDGAFRVLAARTTDTVREILAAQQVQGVTAEFLGDVVTAGVLIRETMAPGNRVQVIYSDVVGSALVCDARPEGRTRGLAQVAELADAFAPGPGGTLQVVRLMHGNKPHQGVVESGDQGDVAEAVMRYFHHSEQVTSMVAFATVLGDDGHLVEAGGFVVQLLPEVTEPPLKAMTERLEKFGPLGPRLAATHGDVEALLAGLLEGEEHTLLADDPVEFHCGCDRSRAVAAAATLGEDDLRGLLEREEELGIDCDYCRTNYVVGPDDYRKLLAAKD